MKKSIIQVFFIGLFIFSIRTNVFASDIFYLNGNIHHFWYLSELSQDDFKWYSVGFERVSETNHNKLNIECFNPIKGITGKGIMAKNGIMLEDDGLGTWYGNFSVMGLSVDSAGIDNDFGTALLGIETRCMVDERSYIDGSLDFSIFGLGGGIFDSGYGVAKIGFNSLFTPNMGFSLGYNWTKIKIKDSDNDVNLKASDNGLNFGVFYSF
jgi:hypothetical protein